MNNLTFLRFLTMMMIMIVLVQEDLSGATSEKVNGSFTTVCGGGDCVIGGEFDLEAEFPVESRVVRMLYDIRTSATSRTGNQNQASVNCPQNQGYRSCLPSSNGGAPRQRCSDFTRNC